ncbi:hypothetical protein ACWA5Z_11510 [Testudinibacter sp. P80/BLE/0925]|uniref:hypothetical protein n=1 Tax=Testudinibacter sp. TW-1 TaxID=3417757 RepID=UPI003D368029
MDFNFISTKLLSLIERLETEAELSDSQLNEALTIWNNAISEIGKDEYDAFGNLLEDNKIPEYTKEQLLLRLDLINHLFNCLVETKDEFMKNDLKYIFPDVQEMNKEFNDRKKIDRKYIILFNFMYSMMKSSINEIYSYTKVSAKVERSIKGKSPKKKKPEQLKAEEWAKDIWEKDNTISLEDMAYQLKDKLDLTQNPRTIINWIRQLNPKRKP